jgi:hypothetical protein
VIGKREASSPSVYPDDPESKHYDPTVFLNETPGSKKHQANGHGANGHASSGEHLTEAQEKDGQDALHFLRHILDEARSKRHDLVTHYTVDDLRVALGFQKPPGEADAGSSTSIADQGQTPVPGRPSGSPHESPDAHPEGGV